MKRIKPDNIEYILIKEPTKKAGYVYDWYYKLVDAIEARSIKQVLKTLQSIIESYHDSCTLLKRIPEPHYQIILMMVAGTCQYKKHSLKFIAKHLGWDKENLLKLVVLLLNTMEPDLIDSPDYEGALLMESDTVNLNRAAKMRYGVMLSEDKEDIITAGSKQWMSHKDRYEFVQNRSYAVK